MRIKAAKASMIICLRTSFLFILFFSLPTVVLAQTKKTDSLEVELQNHIEKDTTRVNLLNALAFSYFSKDLPRSIEYLEKSNALAEEIGFKKGKARSIYIRGITEAIQSNFDQALAHYDEALKLYESIDFKKGIANCYNAMGITFRNKGELRKSISYFKEAIKIEEEIGSDNLSASLLNLGTSYESLGDFDEAISYLRKALSIAEVEKNEQRVGYSLNNLGNVYDSQGNYPLALEHYNKSLYMHKKLDDSLGIANNLVNIGNIYRIQKRYDVAMEYYENSLEIHKRTNRRQGVSSLLNGIGIIHEEVGNHEKALDQYAEALHISKEIGAKSEAQFILNNIGNVYLALNKYSVANQYYMDAKKVSLETGSKQALCDAYIGLAKTHANQKEYKSALSYVIKAKEISKKSGLLNIQKEASEILSRIYTATGNYKDALENHQQFKTLNDSLFNKENVKKIAQLEYEYKYKQALDSASIRELELNKKVLTTSQDLQRSRRSLFLGVIGFLVTAIILGGVIFFLKLRHEKTKTQNIAIEQKLLRSQMTPHFIFNSLSVLQGMILNKENKKSVFYLSKFSKLLRITLENSRDKLVPLNQELEAVNNYLELQNLEASQSYDYTILVDKNIDETLFKIPPMLIQPFIENAIEHAFEDRKENMKIDIQLKYINHELICTITDNGIGIDAQNEHKRKDKKSLATTITTERLKMLSKDFKIEGSVRIEDRKAHNEQGTIVTLVIPYKKNEA